MRRVLLVGAVLAPFNYVVSVPAGDVTLHGLQLWSLVLILCTLVLRPRAVLAALDAPSLLLWTTFAFILASTVLATPDEYRLRGFLDVILLGINLAAFTLVYGHLRHDPTWWAPFARALFNTSLVASGFLVLRALRAAQGGQFLLPDSYMLGLGTVTGTFTAALAAASFLGAVFAPTRGVRTLMLLGVAIHGDAASLSLARGPWLAGAIAGAMTFGLAARVRPTFGALLTATRRATVALLLLLVVSATTAALSSTVTRLVASRVVEVANVSTGTGRARLNLFDALWQDALDSPWFGHGASSYRAISELLQKTGAVSENFLLEMFHAGGALAALPLALVAMLIVIRLMGAVRPPGPTALAAVCLAGVLGLVLGALTNPAGWDTAFWVLIGTAAALPSRLPSPAFAAAPVLETT